MNVIEKYWVEKLNDTNNYEMHMYDFMRLYFYLTPSTNMMMSIEFSAFLFIDNRDSIVDTILFEDKRSKKELINNDMLYYEFIYSNDYKIKIETYIKSESKLLLMKKALPFKSDSLSCNSYVDITFDTWEELVYFVRNYDGEVKMYIINK